jgi:UMF1 family MFS transporter
MKNPHPAKRILSWALYDWANSAFATTVMAAFFPIFFKQFWSAGKDVTLSTFYLGAANSLASILIAATAPALGSIADKGNSKKRFLLFFAIMGIVMTGSLPFVKEGHWTVAAALYVIATVGFSGGNIFYDSLIVDLTEERRMDFVSALGFSFGYLGGGILLALNVAMTLMPQKFGLADASEAVRLAFVSVAIWWGLFSIPIFLIVDEPRTGEGLSGLRALKAGLRQLHDTFQEIRKLKFVFMFLFGYWLYIDGVATIIRMAVDYGMSLGFDYNDLIVALLITQFVGFPATIAFGKIGENLGAKTGIFIAIGVYVAVTCWGYFMRDETEFYVLAVAIGLVQGGIQSLSRSFYARLIPREKAAEFFGFYNMMGKFAAVIGPFLMGSVSFLTGNPRHAIISILMLFISGACILHFVDEREGQRVAELL